MHEIVVDVDMTTNAGDLLFRDTTLSATNIHKEMRLTVKARADAVSSILSENSDGTPWLIWCHTDYEADALNKAIKGTEVRGSDKIEKKETTALAFSDGTIPKLISKPRIFGSGLNFQVCHQVAFVGLSFSYESMYQAIRRVWRFGQNHIVDVYIVRASTEGAILKTIRAKESAHREMQRAMVMAMRQSTLEEMKIGLKLKIGAGESLPIIPNWLKRKLA